MGFLALIWHKLAQAAPVGAAAGVLCAGLLVGCLGGPHPLPPNETIDREVADGAGQIPGKEGGHGGRGGSPAAAGSAAPPVGALAGAGGATSDSAGRGAVDDCDAGVVESGDAAASLCEDDAGALEQ